MSTLFTRIDTVFLQVKDFDRAIEWYHEVLGLMLRWKYDGEDSGYACFNVGETPLTLVRLPEGEQVRHTTHALFNFYTRDIEATHQHLRAKGVDVDPVTRTPGVTFFDFRDPDGNWLSVCHWREG